MADYILLESAKQQHEVKVVVHSSVPGPGPNEKNAVGVKWRDAVLGWAGKRRDPLGDMTSVVPLSVLPAGVQSQLDIGALYEWEGLIKFASWLSDANKLVVIDNWVAVNEPFVFAEMQSRLEFYGLAGSV